MQTILNSLAHQVALNPVGLIGDSLINKKFSDLFGPKELLTIPAKINTELVLAQYDHKKSIFQLRVLPQEGNTCDTHSLKNYLWMMYGLKGSLDQFKKSYLKILNPDVFTKYFTSTSCKGIGTISIEKQINEIKSGKIACINTNTCLPIPSIDYLDFLFSFTYARHPASPTGKEWMQLRTFAEDIIKNIEHVKDPYETAKAVSIFYPTFADKDIMKFYRLITSNNCCFGIDAGIDLIDIGHTSCLMVNKVNKKVEYLFLDSYENKAFDEANNPFYTLPLIDSIKFFVEQPDNFKKTLIRRAYVNLKYNLAENHLAAIELNLNIFLSEEFKDLHLMDDKLFTIYKPYFCKLIKEDMEKNVNHKTAYQDILVKIGCT